MIREIGTDLNILFCYLSPVDREVQVGTEVQKFIFRDRESASSDRHQSPWARGQLKLSPAVDKQVHWQTGRHYACLALCPHLLHGSFLHAWLPRRKQAISNTFQDLHRSAFLCLFHLVSFEYHRSGDLGSEVGSEPAHASFSSLTKDIFNVCNCLIRRPCQQRRVYHSASSQVIKKWWKSRSINMPCKLLWCANPAL